MTKKEEIMANYFKVRERHPEWNCLDFASYFRVSRRYFYIVVEIMAEELGIPKATFLTFPHKKHKLRGKNETVQLKNTSNIDMILDSIESIAREQLELLED